MDPAIFLSAGVPDPRRGPQYAVTADVVAIGAAVSALIHVVIGRRMLIWGGQPGITPMIWHMAKAAEVDYGAWVRLYQSSFFDEDFPAENAEFRNVVRTARKPTREDSLALMRAEMFSENTFSAAVFIGGMGGIREEAELFSHAHPRAKLIPLASTGGAAAVLADELGSDRRLATDLEYITLLHELLDVDPREIRYARPDLQPANREERVWRPEPQT